MGAGASLALTGGLAASTAAVTSAAGSLASSAAGGLVAAGTSVANKASSAANNVVNALSKSKIAELGKSAVQKVVNSFKGNNVKTLENKSISVNTTKWLNSGESNYSVYHGIQEGESVYTGITKQPIAQRLYQHNYNGKGFERLKEIYSGIGRNQARAIEQYFINNGPANTLNKINSISPSSQYYNEALIWAENYIK